MYEDKTRRNIQINWKSLFIKLGILLVVIFIIIWIVSLFNKDKEVTSNFGTNLQSMRNAATEYFTGSRLPKEINESTSLTLGEMFERNLLIEFQDENGNSCDVDNSYIEATKLDDENYRIEVRLVCDNDSDTIINTVKYQSQNDAEIDDDTTDEPVIDDANEDGETDNSNVDDNTNNNSNQGSQSNNGGTSTQRPNHSGSSNTNNNSNSSSNNSSSNNNNSNNNQKPIATACSYGKKEYATTYPLAYVVSGDCAVSYSSISGSHANNATRIGNNEYLKLTNEMRELSEKTGVKITVSAPQFSKILNKTGKGYVGYQIYFSAKQVTTYSNKTIYSYYLDQNGNRRVIIDSRNSLSSSNNNSGSTNVNVNSIVLNRSSLTLDVGEAYTLQATISPSNATNKKVTWSSSNTKVATVSSSGKVTAKREGTATITAKVGSKSDTVRVTVNEEDIRVTRVEINRSSLTLDEGDTYTLRATVTPSNATNKKVTWSSSNTKVATVSSSGKVTAKREGTATITAKADGKTDTIRVTVNEEKKTVTKTYYLMSYVDASYVGNYYVQDFIFNDILYDDVDFVYVKVDYYDGYSDFRRYANIKNSEREIELYLGYQNEGNLQVVGADDLYHHALDESNFTYANTMATTMNRHYGVRITTYINNVRGVSKYSNSYFVPLKVTVTYQK